MGSHRGSISPLSLPSGAVPSVVILHHMLRILLVLAEHLKNIGVGQQFKANLHRDRPGERLGIVKRHLDIQMPKIAAMEALGQTQGFTMEVATPIHNASIVKAGGFNHKNIAL